MKKPTDTALAISADYREFIEDLKARVVSARISAARAVTHEAILLYWDIGRGIVEKQRTFGWGDSVVEMVAADLRKAFPGVRVFPVQRLAHAATVSRILISRISGTSCARNSHKGWRHARAIPGKAVSGKAG